MGKIKTIAIFAIIILFSISVNSSSYASSKIATGFVNKLQSLFDKRGLPVKVKLINDKPYKLEGFREVVIDIKGRKSVYLTNGKLIIPAVIDQNTGVNLLKQEALLLNKVDMKRFSFGQYNRVIGKKDAKIKIVLFSDFQCPYCRRLWPYLVNLPKTYNVAVYEKNYPLPFHKDAMLLAKIAEAVRIASGKKINDYLNRNDFSGGNKAIIKKVIKDNKLGKYAEKINKLIDSKQVKEIISKDMAEGHSVDITGTPTLFIDGYRVTGADVRSIEMILKRETKNKKS
ncbi:MAG: hypothetical protein IEMM0003_0846 [bacterium]|nr:MAG: hypothetical protein IEMM0003_0846 [bacterium]